MSLELAPRSAIRLAGDAVSVAVHRRAIAGLAGVDRVLAERAHLVAPRIGDAALDRRPLLGAHHRQLDLGQDPQGAGEGQRRVKRDVAQSERFPRTTATMASHGPRMREDSCCGVKGWWR